MQSTKTIILEIYKEEGEYSISNEDKQIILLKLASEVYEMAEKFDGCCEIRIEINICGKGNI